MRIQISWNGYRQKWRQSLLNKKIQVNKYNIIGSIDQTGILTGHSGGTTEITVYGGCKISNVTIITVNPAKLGDLILFGGITIGAIYMILRKRERYRIKKKV